jgi:hypothetical protein
MAAPMQSTAEVVQLASRSKPKRMIWVQVDADVWASLMQSARTLAKFEERA